MINQFVIQVTQTLMILALVAFVITPATLVSLAVDHFVTHPFLQRMGQLIIVTWVAALFSHVLRQLHDDQAFSPRPEDDNDGAVSADKPHGPTDPSGGAALKLPGYRQAELPPAEAVSAFDQYMSVYQARWKLENQGLDGTPEHQQLSTELDRIYHTLNRHDRYRVEVERADAWKFL